MIETQIVYSRGDVVEVDLTGANHREKKNNPRINACLCVVVQNDGGNQGPLTIVAPITTIDQYKGYRMQVDVRDDEQRGPLNEESTIECGHLRSVDRRRVRRRLGSLPKATMVRVDGALLASLGLAAPPNNSN